MKYYSLLLILTLSACSSNQSYRSTAKFNKNCLQKLLNNFETFEYQSLLKNENPLFRKAIFKKNSYLEYDVNLIPHHGITYNFSYPYFSISPFLTPHSSLLLKKVSEVANLNGNIIKSIKITKKTRMKITFENSPYFPSERFSKRPKYTIQQEDEMNKAIPHQPFSTYASGKEFYSEKPEGNLLTKKQLKKMKPGLYSFVVLPHEKTIRFGAQGHHRLGAKMEVLAAGDIFIRLNPLTHENEIYWISNRSDTYLPRIETLKEAVYALWQHNIYPTKIQFRDFSNKKIVFESN